MSRIPLAGRVALSPGVRRGAECVGSRRQCCPLSLHTLPIVSTMRPIPLAFCVLTLGAIASAQATHTLLTPAVSPTARAGTHGVGDASGMWVFGGLTVGGATPVFSNEMWRFDGAAWSLSTPAQSPPARDWYASAWDAGRGRYVLFGGRGYPTGGTTQGDFGDTWEFDGTNWTQLTPPASPSARRWAAMTYDATLAKCVLFGGATLGTTFLGDTWTWDGAAWAQLAPTTSPSPRARGWLEWDSLRNRALYFGGKNTTANLALGETWSWDGASWTQLTTVTQPGWNGGIGLIAFGMTFDAMRDRMVVVGGTRTTASVSNQTWEFDGVDWLLRPTGALTPRTAPAVAFVPAFATSYVFGGSSGTLPIGDTWSYQTDDFPAALAFGSGCAGGGGTMQIAETAPAWAGSTHRAAVGNVDPLAFQLGLIGLSNTAWNTLPLPFPLSFAVPTTSPTCLLLVSPDVSNLLPIVGGVGEIALPIPNDPALGGFVLHEQAVQFDLAFTFSVSAGLSLTIGLK